MTRPAPASKAQRDMAAGEPFLKVEGVSKAFPGVLANDDVSFDLRGGEIHALLGENGAGKTTLVSMLFGLLRPDTGRILVDGDPLELGSPRDAIARGLAFVQQHYSLIPALIVTDNIMLSQRYGRRGHLSRAACQAKIAEVSTRYALPVRLNARIEQLSVAEQQRVELIKALMDDPRVLILDEPTALLSREETTALWSTLRTLAKSGVGIILIAHKLEEVIAIADRITVLRRGRSVVSLSTDRTDVRSLGALMVSGIDVRVANAASARAPGDIVLKVDNMTVGGGHDTHAVRDASFDVRAGEIVGLGGVVGAGQVELLEAIAGVRPCRTGSIALAGLDITALAAKQRQLRGLAYVPPDRHRDGLVGSLSIADNLALAASGIEPAVSCAGMLRPSAIAAHAERAIARFDIRSGGPQTPCSKLSGGNQQKVILARELSRDPKAILCCYPTRGLDFAATAAVHSELREAASKGTAVLVVSLDLTELLTLCDRVLVMQGGRMQGGGLAAELTEEQLGLLIGGGAST